MDDVTGDSFTLQDLACAIPSKCSIERVPDPSSMKSSDEDSNLLGSDGLPVRLSGEWIRRKHHYLDRYCAITATGMKNRFSERVFLDVMSGPGLCRIKDSGEELSGSPLIAMKHDFTKFVFVESDGDLATALEKRIQNHPKAKLSTIIHRDWTREVAAGRLTFSGLVVAFVDPTGIKQVPWEAMKQLLTSNPKIDILATLQYAMGITLNVYQYLDSGSEQTTALDTFLGERDWRSWPREATDAAFTARVINSWVEKLGALGFQGSGQITVEANGSPLYHLALFSRHPKADEFWRKIATIDESGQRELL
jgi:three-Cys-motif partner protein